MNGDSERRWRLTVVPPDGEAREVSWDERQHRRLRAAVVAGVLLVASMGVALAIAAPRAWSYGPMVEENLAMRLRLMEIDARMREVDRVLLRLRLYEAQAKGIPQAPARPSGEGAAADGGEQAPSDWAMSLQHRAEGFLRAVEAAEPGVFEVLADAEHAYAVQSALPSRWPTQGYLSSPYGWRRSPFGRRKWVFHDGLDIAADRGTPVVAVARGRVIRAGWHEGYGRAVEIDHGFGITTLYGHNWRLHVREGDRVEVGDRIAAMGSTGRSTGPHCHFEVRIDGNPVDPAAYLKGGPPAPRTR